MLAALHDVGIDARYCEHLKDDIEDAARGMDMLIAAGGDGTVTSVVTGTADRGVPVAILPLGGSNNIARALGIRQSPESVIHGLPQAREQQLTIGAVTGPFGRRLFVEAVGLGALNDAIERVDEDPDTPQEKRENGRMAFREALAEGAPFDCILDIDGQSFEGPWLLIEVLNIPAIGPRLPFAPRADPADGYLDVLLVREADREAMTLWAEHFSGPPPARIEAGRRISLEGRGMCTRIDDRPVDLPNEDWRMTLELDGAPATILIPRTMKVEEA
ncbi:MAG: diacylglycerol kinase family protein [Sphingobium sp.]